MDAWSATITDHTNSNAPLQTAWSGVSWAHAAELIKYAYGNWPNSGRFGTMLRNVYLPRIVNGSTTSNGNWELVMTEATLGISVFLEDRAVYDRAVAKYRTRVPAFVYIAAEGALPKAPPNSGIDTRDEIIRYWHEQSTFSEGLTQETCRDFGHTGFGIASIADFAETTRIQGQSLYPEIADRLPTALGFHSRYELQAPPSWLCGGTVDRGLGPVTEVGYNHLNTRLGITMPNTKTYTESHRPQGTNHLFVSWQTLTRPEPELNGRDWHPRFFDKDRPRHGPQRGREPANPGVLPAIPSTWRSPITPCQGAQRNPRQSNIGGAGPLTRCDSPEGGRRDGRQTDPCQTNPVAKPVVILETCPSGEEPPEAKPVRRGQNTPCKTEPEQWAQPAKTQEADQDQLARAMPNPHPDPGGVPPCQLTSGHRQNQAHKPNCG